ncbi:hypothetical protein HBI81_041450 [Parastagonospora nodorum]|nr:hypothetical protein HBI12_135790 [Parastagonospora nodorum]KAH5989157.1 hypothetical protein HBI84_192280 [Parastagonospora nodorum]KAH6540324.1 hypothetical protein HBI81_041450 [Parastagonospora nodorum]
MPIPTRTVRLRFSSVNLRPYSSLAQHKRDDAPPPPQSEVLAQDHSVYLPTDRSIKQIHVHHHYMSPPAVSVTILCSRRSSPCDAKLGRRASTGSLYPTLNGSRSSGYRHFSLRRGQTSVSFTWISRPSSCNVHGG